MSKASILTQMRAAAERAQGYAADVAAAAAGAIEELDEAKADKAQGMAVTIPTTGWITEEVTHEPDGDDMEVGQDLRYPNYYDITAQVTAADRADVIIETASLYDAGACGWCPTVETLAGKIRVRAQQVPDKGIRAQYWITKGATK